MSLIGHIFSNFYASIFVLLSVGGILVAVSFWLIGDLFPWGIVCFLASLFLFTMSKALAKRGSSSQ